MRILIINPNSDLKMTEAIQKTAEQFDMGRAKVKEFHLTEQGILVKSILA